MPLFSVSEVLSNGRSALLNDFITPAGMAAWLLQLATLTVPGMIFSSFAIAASFVIQFPERPWLALAAPIYLLPLVFLTFILVLLSTITHMATTWAFEQIFGKPEPTKLLHRIGYFALSIPIWVLVALIFGTGDEADCSGPSRYC